MKAVLVALVFALLAPFPVLAQLGCFEDEASIEIRNGENLVLRYNKQPTDEAAKNDPLYSRTGYIHPLCTPSGKVVTGDYAEDHPHQHGLFFAWTKTSFEGRAPEFWNQKQGSGRIRYVKTLGLVPEPEACGFDVEHLFEDLTAPEGPAPVLIETWKVRVRLAGGRYHVDVHSIQRCASKSPLTIEKYHYGGMAIRGPASWLGEEDGRITTSEGKGRVAGNHSRPAWVKMTGDLDGAACGVAAFGHPGNFRAPHWVRLHPSKPYFVFAPMVEESFVIAPDKAYESRYRFVVFDGQADAASLGAIAEDFAKESATGSN